MFIEDFRRVDWDSIVVLPHNTAPQWGQMTLQHMIEHLTDVTRLSNGTMKVEVITPPDRLEKLRRVVLFSDRELQHNVAGPIIPASPIPYRTANMGEAIGVLLFELQKFEEHFAHDKHKTEIHPLFGAMNYYDWEVFQKKHFTHHFKQFNLM